MPSVTFIQHDGSERSVEAAEGVSLLEAAHANDVEGMIGECGGCLSCATCHVYVDEAWLDRTGAVSADEDAMLDGTYDDRAPNSRLGCQIALSADLDGLVVRLPERQT